MTDDEIKSLALQIYRGEVFTSLQVPERDNHLLPMIFMVIALMSGQQRRALASDKSGMVYGTMATASARSINGYPILMDLHIVSQEDTQKVWAKLQEIQSAMEAL